MDAKEKELIAARLRDYCAKQGGQNILRWNEKVYTLGANSIYLSSKRYIPYDRKVYSSRR